MPASDLARIILSRTRLPISYFALHKLFYIAEVRFGRHYGKRLTNAYIIRQAEGPYVTDLQAKKLLKSMPGVALRTLRGKLFVDSGGQRSLPMFPDDTLPPTEARTFVFHTLDNYINKSDAQLKTIAYLTRPMRELLALEKQSGIILNRPIRFTR
jgi:hypothetical protein